MQLDPKNLKPLPGYVLVKPAEKKEKTESGIYLPESHEDQPQKGTVLSVGDEWKTQEGATIKPPIKEKAEVIYKKWGGNEVQIGDTEYQFLKFEDILATIEK